MSLKYAFSSVACIKSFVNCVPCVNTQNPPIKNAFTRHRTRNRKHKFIRQCAVSNFGYKCKCTKAAEATSQKPHLELDSLHVAFDKSRAQTELMRSTKEQVQPLQSERVYEGKQSAVLA